MGYISDASNPRIAFAVGGVATLVASVPLFFLATRQRVARAAISGTEVLAADDGSNVVQMPLIDRATAQRQRRTV
jgi:hypothetical protein